MADETKDERILDPVKDCAGVLALAVRWGGAVVVGGISLLLYAGEIGQFPSGIGLGEGLALLYLHCVLFVLLSLLTGLL